MSRYRKSWTQVLGEVRKGTEAKEVVVAEADYKYDGKVVKISKKNFSKVHKDYKNSTKGKETMLINDPKTNGTISVPVQFEEVDWDRFKIWDNVANNNEPIIRAYSMASYPAEGRKIMLNVRVAAPPWDRDKNAWMDVNPGVVSSYIFNQKVGDEVTISGPYGEFFINDSEAEMLYVGGGAGMAPMRSHLYELFKTLKTGRTVTYWYGGRSRAELFYILYFRDLEKELPNFKFFLVLSDAVESDKWVNKKDVNDPNGDGFSGFVHQVVIDEYLNKHEAPEDIELYFCGPPMMNVCVQKMGEDFGIPDENIRFDDFGG